MSDPKCKICRRAGEKLFLKGERCYTPKCAMVRHSLPPGMHGKRKGKRASSEYGSELREKQKIRFLYGLSGTQLGNYIKKASQRKTGVLSDNLVIFLETRLDNAAFRAGFAISRSLARHLVTHGHITVNNKITSTPSFSVSKDDILSIRPESASMPLLKNISEFLKKYQAPSWITIDANAKTAKIVSLPKMEDAQLTQNLKLVVQYYSR